MAKNSPVHQKPRAATARPSPLKNSGRNGPAQFVKPDIYNPMFSKCENTKFTRELDTYGFDENGIGEELLFPIRLNGKPGENQETNLATYLIKFKEFEKNDVKITKVQDKEGFLN